MSGYSKKYTDMDVRWTREGEILPTAVLWETEDGRERYEIEKILSGPRSMASEAGGVGKRYEVRIHRSVRVLYLEKDRWYILSAKGG